MKVSVIVPVFGEATRLDELVARVQQTLGDDCHEIILVDDVGPGERWTVIEGIVKSTPRAIGVLLARNFGQHNAILCGLSLSSGEIAVTIDDDLQHPPEEIPKLISAMKVGVEVVYGNPKIRKHEWMRNAGSWLICKLFKATFKTPVRPSAFRALSRRVVERITRYDRSFVFLDGLISWETDRLAEVEVAHLKRTHGRSGYSPSRLVLLALNFLTAFSLKPLQLSSLAGVLFALFAFLLGSVLLIRKLFIGIPVPGYASLAVLIAFLGGVQLVSLGVIGEYLGRLLMNSNGRPPFSVFKVLKSDK